MYTKCIYRETFVLFADAGSVLAAVVGVNLGSGDMFTEHFELFSCEGLI